jgi:type I restriction enzyme S subunit
MVKKATGQSYPAVSDRIVKESVFPLLSLGEQRRIAAILDQADMLLRARCRSIKRLDELGQSIFNAMFGDPVTNPKKWDIGLCSDQCSRITVGVVVKPASYYKESGVPALRSVNIKSEGINFDDIVYFSEEDNLRKLSKTRVWSGDLVIVRSGRPGLAAVIPNEMDGINAIDLLIATPNQEKITPIFFREFINSPGGKRIVLSQKRGQVQQHFNVGSLSNATMILPPIDLQRKFEDRLKLIASQRETMHRGSNDVENLFRSLQQRAFHGEL